MTTIHTEAFRRIEADETGFSVTCTSSDSTLEVALNANERRALADALDPGRDFSGVDWKTMYEREIRNRVAAVARLRRERDEALRKKGEMVDRAVRAERERDAAVERAEKAEQLIPAYAMVDVWMALGRDSIHFDDWYDEHGYADAWAELTAAVREARTAPAVTRADIEKAMADAAPGLVPYGACVDAVHALVSGSDPAVPEPHRSGLDMTLRELIREAMSEARNAI